MKHRIFVAIDIPEELKKMTEKYIAPFRENNLARVAERENWHITVVFCGYLDDKKLDELKKITEKITNETKGFELIPDKIIFKNERMVWLTFKHSPEFSKLSRQFSDFSQNNHEQLPHLTLVRFEKKHYSNLKKSLPENGVDLENETKPFMTESINIMESRLAPSGPKHELLCRNCLK